MGPCVFAHLGWALIHENAGFMEKIHTHNFVDGFRGITACPHVFLCSAYWPQRRTCSQGLQRSKFVPQPSQHMFSLISGHQAAQVSTEYISSWSDDEDEVHDTKMKMQCMKCGWSWSAWKWTSWNNDEDAIQIRIMHSPCKTHNFLEQWWNNSMKQRWTLSSWSYDRIKCWRWSNRTSLLYLAKQDVLTVVWSHKTSVQV